MDNIYAMFAEQAAVRGSAPAFFTPEGEVSYQAFLTQVDAVAGGLAAQGIGKGERVATVALNSVPHFAVLVACAKLGVIAFPANRRLAPAELQQALALVEPTALFIEPSFTGAVADADLSGVRLKAAWGADVPAGFIAFDAFLAESADVGAVVGRDDPLVIIATAAVAGVARGGVLTHGNLLSVSKMFCGAYGLSDADCFLGVLPFFHIAGYEMLMVVAYAGGASVILPGFDAEAGSQMMDAHQVSLIATFPPMLQMLLDAREAKGNEWNNLRTCFGILNPPDVIQRYLVLGKGAYWTGYGQTETTGITTLINVMEKPGAAGKVVPGLQMRIVSDLDEDVPVGQPGEIAVQGNLVFAGYWRDEEASAYAARNGWHHTGDLGKVDGDGYLYYVGRKPEKELIKSGGENIYPAEVEGAIMKLPQVAAVCVIGVQDERWGETVKAVVALHPGQTLTEDALLAGISEYLAAYKKPRLIEFAADLPRSESGAVDREAVRQQYG